MKHRFVPALFIATLLTTAGFSAEAAQNFGIVNFGTCVSDSKLGKQEQASFESLKKQMTSFSKTRKSSSMNSLQNSMIPIISMGFLPKRKRSSK